MVRVEGSVFAGRDRPGDFTWMIEQPEYADALFVFNDNESQFRDHRLHPPGAQACLPGGGNAAIRPYQCRIPRRAAGIPTGAAGGYGGLTPHVASVIDEAVGVVAEVAAEEGYRRIIYSAADETGALGTGIFDVGEDVKQYIVRRLRAQAGP